MLGFAALITSAYWRCILLDACPASQSIEQKWNQARQNAPVYPPPEHTFHAFNLVEPDAVSVVILGQDPYHQRGQANGLAFSVNTGWPIPPSLRNIRAEMARDLLARGERMQSSQPGHPIGTEHKHGDSTHECVDGNLEYLAKQGVLLLNSSLSVEDSRPLSHKDIGWEEMTDAAIGALARDTRPKCFLLWGKMAQSTHKKHDFGRHLVLSAPHPSPLSAYRGFVGCRHFSQANDFLASHNRPTIDWLPAHSA